MQSTGRDLIYVWHWEVEATSCGVFDRGSAHCFEIWLCVFHSFGFLEGR